MKSWRIAGIVMLLTLVAGTNLYGQAAGSFEKPQDWQIGVYTGWLSGEKLGRTRVAGEAVDARMDDGWLFGVRASVEETYLGAEVRVAGLFSSLDVDADPAADIPTGDDADGLLLNLDLVVYPLGDTVADGRIRPYVSAGPGLAYIDTDFEPFGSEAMLDLNIGGGSKFLLGDEGNMLLQVDFRWHRWDGSGAFNDNIWPVELTVGLGMRF